MARAITDTESTPTAKAARITESLSSLAAINDATAPAVTRLGFTKREREAHALVAQWLRDLGAKVWSDEVGNTIAELAGTEKLPAIAFGSHLDTVPLGGAFDGAVGVVGSVELARLVVESGTRTRHPIRIVAFSCEEGARFGQACIGSKAAIGDLPPSALHDLQDAKGTTLGQAMSEIGLKPTSISLAKWSLESWAAFIELHIEQGRILESMGIPVGLVDVVSGSTRLRVDLRGRADHSGGTPMGDRSDALAAAAELVLMAEAMALMPQNHGVRITVGRLEVLPNNITTIPGEVIMSVDVRDIDPERQREVAQRFVEEATRACSRRGVHASFSLIGDLSPSVMPVWLREVLVTSCRDGGIPYRVMTSGSSHDAQVVNRRIPSAVVFIPSRGGLSHVPSEWSSSADIAVACDMLRDVLARLDAEVI